MMNVAYFLSKDTIKQAQTLGWPRFKLMYLDEFESWLLNDFRLSIDTSYTYKNGHTWMVYFHLNRITYEKVKVSPDLTSSLNTQDEARIVGITWTINHLITQTEIIGRIMNKLHYDAL